MDDILEKLCDKYEVDREIIDRIIKIEKNNVHKQRRHGIYGNLRYIVNQAVKEEEDNDN